MSPAVRPLAEGDLPAAAAIEATAPDAWSFAALAEERLSETGRVFGLYEDDRLLGVAVFQLVLDEASLLAITVHPSQRGKGLGEMLLHHCLAALAQEGAAQCFLEVRSQNIPALTLYKKSGFIQTGKRRGFYKNPPDDALVMTCKTERK